MLHTVKKRARDSGPVLLLPPPPAAGWTLADLRSWVGLEGLKSCRAAMEQQRSA
jgi:hypothetical protein